MSTIPGARDVGIASITDALGTVGLTGSIGWPVRVGGGMPKANREADLAMSDERRARPRRSRP